MTSASADVVLRVGSGCTYSNIQAAINAIPIQGSGVIRIRSGTFNENLSIVGKTVELLGGHANCTTTSPTGTTQINGSGSTSSVISFLVLAGPTNASHTLVTERLLLFGGTGNALSPGGGITVFADTGRTAAVTLEQTIVRGNQTSLRGGGIMMHGPGSGSLTLLGNSQIDGNRVTGTSPYGGGLYCAGNFGILVIGGSVLGNTAGAAGDSSGRGGGIYLDGCDMNWFAQNALAVSDDASLRNNVVYGNGAGLYAEGAADVSLSGSHFALGGSISSRPLRIRDNRAIGATGSGGGVAGGIGGGVYATGAGTEVTVDRAWTYNNEADAAGGAFSSQDGAFVEVVRASQTCHTPRNCSRIFDNHATIASGALEVRRAQATISRTIVTRNDSVFGGVGTRASIYGFESTVRVRDSLVHGPVGPGHALASWGGEMRVERSTIADTSPSRAVFGLNGNARLDLFNSIVHEAAGGPVVNVGGGTPTASVDCVLWHDDGLAGFGSATRTVLGDPRFVDRQNDLFYLRPGSPAINFCNVAPPAPAVDLDWNPRGICHSVEPPICPVEQIYDLGAYEFPLGLFSDRFEAR
ncbi:MAG: hypothetical protein ACOCVP_05115 [Wenzhouxiangella sp.]